MTDITLTVVLPLLGAFLLPLTRDNALAWLGRLFGPLLLAVSAWILFMHWSTFSAPEVVILGGFAPPLGIVFYIDRLALLFALAVPLMTLLLWPGDAEKDGAAPSVADPAAGRVADRAGAVRRPVQSLRVLRTGRRRLVRPDRRQWIGGGLSSPPSAT